MSAISENGFKMIEALEKDGMYIHLGLEFLELDEFHARARFLLRDDLKNPYGSAHGGVLYSAADIISGTVACTSGWYHSTVTGNFNYMLPGMTKDYIYIDADLVRRGGHITVMDVKIKNDEGKLIDAGTFNFFRTEIPSI